MNKLLNTYLDKGIPDSSEKVKSNRKFSNVGLLTRNRGGYANNSVNGLNA